MSPEEARSIRDAMVACLPRDAARYGGDPPDLRLLYVPEAHARALSPDNMVVSGIRGAGKTFWWQSLRDDRLRAEIARRLPRARLGAVSKVVTGFGGDSAPDRYPGRDVITRHLGEYSARTIWRAVLLRALEVDEMPPPAQWAERFAWVAAHPEQTDQRLAEVDRSGGGRPILVVFDALDRAATGWDELVALHQGLLEVLLDLRQMRSVRGKAFLRADLLDEPGVVGFTDASKLLRDVVELRWSPTDLYGLAWQYIGNARDVDGSLHPGAASIRRLVSRASRVEVDLEADPWDVPEPARRSSDVQCALMDEIAGQWMGTDRRRGQVYTWLPNHLLDGRKQVSPRSFLVALHAAAEATPPDHPLPLDWRAIQAGVAQASAVRVTEITREEHPWVELAGEALRGLRIPAEPHDLFERWRANGTVEAIAGAQLDGPPRRHLHEREEGLLADLINLGVAYRLGDGRIQVPDVYRVQFGALRRGGVSVAQ